MPERGQNEGNASEHDSIKRAKVRIVPLYLNDILWKYVTVDLNLIGWDHTATLIPGYVTCAARSRFRNRKVTFQDFAEQVKFRRFDIPIAEGLKDIRYYGTSRFLRVNKHHTLTFDLPTDPEDDAWKISGS